MDLNELKKILQKEINFDGEHIPYQKYSAKLTIANCKNDFLKSTFSEWENTPYFLAGLYNLCVRLPNNTSIEDLKTQLHRIDSIPYEKDYFIAGQKYYAKKIPFENNSPWRECVLSIEKYNSNTGDGNYVSLSELREYLCDNPVLHCWPGFCETDEYTKDKLIEDGLINKPYEEEVAALG